MGDLPETVDGLPNISGAEAEVEGAIAAAAGRPVFLPDSRIDFSCIKSAFANALHMHQPLIPAGGRDLRTAEVIGNLQHMFENQGVGDNHNASEFQSGATNAWASLFRSSSAKARSRASCSSTRARSSTACASRAPTTCSTP